MSTTLDQIARAAKVSVSTASRALNGHPAISSQTAHRVRTAAQRLQYRQRRSHRRWEARRSLFGTHVAVVSLGMDRSLMALPVISSILAGAEAALSDAGATVQLAHVPQVEQPPTSLLRQKLDGVILSGALQGDMLSRAAGELFQRLRNLPTVWLLGRPRGCWGDAVAVNDYAVGAWAAEYLVQRGHRRLAFVNPKPDHVLFMRREDGFVAAARRLGAEVRSYCQEPKEHWELPLKAPVDVETVQGLIDELLADAPRPSAIFAAADSVAVLVYRALAVRDLKVGRDISVISGNNDLPMIAGLHPHLTTADVHADLVGRLAVGQLAMRLSCDNQLPESELMIPPTPVEGESVATVGV